MQFRGPGSQLALTLGSQIGAIPDHTTHNESLLPVNIGEGYQATIYEQSGSDSAFKKERLRNSELKTNLLAEYGIHRTIEEAWKLYTQSIPQTHGPVNIGMENRDIILRNPLGTCSVARSADGKVNTDVRVPRLMRYYIKEEAKAAAWKERPPKDDDSPTAVLEMERIYTLVGLAIQSLAMEFHGPENVVKIMANDSNKHCLVRPYLGRTRPSAGPFLPDRAPMRNFRLYLDDMKKMGIDVEHIAREMGRAFAVMQWGAGVDGDDVEFVLGATMHKIEDGSQELVCTTRLWLLDFGQCQSVDFSDLPDEVYQAFKGVMVTGTNQDFIPSVKNKPLWNLFCGAYEHAARR
ncbi:hypothetical protein B0T16DRAFT_441396 [Cercophora newfieldiana]|uniref:Uncharacterized protein n=1 Tax=Cercophora newfieldiana TaxID=92897 RepID=A0AA39YPS2_9PEZI|nr:hypothetical protein B0T16DRAFT_441396 [Cercophora newfieldiana]